VPAGAVGPSGCAGSLAWNAAVWKWMPGAATISPAPTAPRSAWRRVSAGPEPTLWPCARKRGPRDPQEACPDISRCSLPAARGTRRANGVAPGSVAPDGLPCDTRDRYGPCGTGSGHSRCRARNGGETWPITEPARDRRDRSPRSGSSTAPPEGIWLGPPVWRRICCTTTTSNCGRSRSLPVRRDRSKSSSTGERSSPRRTWTASPK
jgi:hypothetical protein